MKHTNTYFGLLAVALAVSLVFPNLSIAQSSSASASSSFVETTSPLYRPAPSCVNISYYLGYGSSDRNTAGQITMLQRFLTLQGYYSGPITGYLGVLTRAAVTKFQIANSVSPVTGGVGPITRSVIKNLSCDQGPKPTGSVKINYINPSLGIVGSSVTLYGSNFSSSNNTIHFGGGVVPNVVSNNGTSLTFNVPTALDPACYFTVPRCMTFAASQLVKPGVYAVSVENSNGTSNSINFTVTSDTTTSAPKITSINPSYGPVGTVVTINGSGFTSDNNVKFDMGATTHVNSVDGKTLTLKIPSYVGASCPFATPNCAVIMIAKEINPGSYTISIENVNGLSNAVTFNVTSGVTPPVGQKPVITGSSGPTELIVGQVGTWSIQARDPLNGQLTYSVRWGDEPLYQSSNSASMMPPYYNPDQSAAFTHSYSQVGTYTVTFSISNSAGELVQSTMTVNVR